MIRVSKLLTLSAVALSLAACNSSSDREELDPVNPPPTEGSAELRIHHIAANAPMVNIMANGTLLEDLEGVDYQMSSPLLDVAAGTYAIQVDGALPDDEWVTVIDAELDLAEDVRYDVFALGILGGDAPFEFGPFIIDRPIEDVTEGEGRLLVLHGAPLDVPVDVYLAAAGTEINAGSPAFTIAYQEYEEVSTPEGEYEVTLTVAGEPAQVLYTSPAIELSAGDDLVVTATLNTAANAANAPLALLITDADDSNVVYSTTTGADVRVVHAIADAPGVDIYANAVTAEPVVSNLSFGEFTDYLNVAADDYEFFVTPTSDTTEVLVAEFELTSGWQGSVFAAGELGNEEANLQAVALDNRRLATEARLRVIHASPFAGDVDIYVTPSNDFTAYEPAFESVPFELDELATTGNVGLTAGVYYITVTLAGEQGAALGPLEVELSESGIYTVVAVGNDAETLGVILMDDFAPNAN